MYVYTQIHILHIHTYICMCILGVYTYINIYIRILNTTVPQLSLENDIDFTKEPEILTVY